MKTHVHPLFQRRSSETVELPMRSVRQRVLESFSGLEILVMPYLIGERNGRRKTIFPSCTTRLVVYSLSGMPIMGFLPCSFGKSMDRHSNENRAATFCFSSKATD